MVSHSHSPRVPHPITTTSTTFTRRPQTTTYGTKQSTPLAAPSKNDDDPGRVLRFSHSNPKQATPPLLSLPTLPISLSRSIHQASSKNDLPVNHPNLSNRNLREEEKMLEAVNVIGTTMTEEHDLWILEMEREVCSNRRVIRSSRYEVLTLPGSSSIPLHQLHMLTSHSSTKPKAENKADLNGVKMSSDCVWQVFDTPYVVMLNSSTSPLPDGSTRHPLRFICTRFIKMLFPTPNNFSQTHRFDLSTHINIAPLSDL
ncbi:hypothetical protein BLNAU_20713 [Blattamonas nauphoetae]|uniref:Uncharacterized protein n=1 Tax=Blattamonas nauphoetae TaxID=2049346 RepID=A0ABQ9WYH0_9EUKA|nr:hypothetical protein BLNAU_20713 [Blattamonas nauphoetae]